MGCDHFADENGVFEMSIYLYNGGRKIGRVRITDLEPFTKIDSEVEYGSSR